MLTLQGNGESSEMNSNSSETDILGSERGSETKDLIINIIKQDPHITAAEIAMQLNMSSRGKLRSKYVNFVN